MDTALACESKGASCAEHVVTDTKFSYGEPGVNESEVDASLGHMGANGLPSGDPNCSELPAVKLAMFEKEAEMESDAVPGFSSNVKSKDICGEGCLSSCPRSAGSRPSQVVSDDETQFSVVVPTVMDAPIHSVRDDDNTAASCTDCAACLCGVSLDLVNGTKTWDVMSGLLVMSRTPRERPSPNAGSVHPDPRSA